MATAVMELSKVKRYLVALSAIFIALSAIFNSYTT
jgi:hypothetical protein